MLKCCFIRTVLKGYDLKRFCCKIEARFHLVVGYPFSYTHPVFQHTMLKCCFIRTVLQGYDLKRFCCQIEARFHLVVGYPFSYTHPVFQHTMLKCCFRRTERNVKRCIQSLYSGCNAKQQNGWFTWKAPAHLSKSRDFGEWLILNGSGVSLKIFQILYFRMQ